VREPGDPYEPGDEPERKSTTKLAAVVVPGPVESVPRLVLDEDRDQIVTLSPKEAHCPWCSGSGCVPEQTRERWMATYPALHDRDSTS
jgi:hypothetical protein